MRADFRVGGVPRAQFRAMRDALGKVLDEVYKVLLNCPAAIGIAKGKESRECTTVPRLPRSRKAATPAPQG